MVVRGGTRHPEKVAKFDKTLQGMLKYEPGDRIVLPRYLTVKTSFSIARKQRE